MAEVTLDGTLERITFRNPDNGYTVARLASRDGEVTIVGSLVGIEEGMPVRLSGVRTPLPSRSFAAAE